MRISNDCNFSDCYLLIGWSSNWHRSSTVHALMTCLGFHLVSKDSLKALLEYNRLTKKLSRSHSRPLWVFSAPRWPIQPLSGFFFAPPWVFSPPLRGSFTTPPWVCAPPLRGSTPPLPGPIHPSMTFLLPSWICSTPLHGLLSSPSCARFSPLPFIDLIRSLGDFSLPGA